MPRDDWQRARHRDIARRAASEKAFDGREQARRRAKSKAGPTKMPFGKYRNRLLKDIPAPYRRWLLATLHEVKYATLRGAITDSLVSQKEAVG